MFEIFDLLKDLNRRLNLLFYIIRKTSFIFPFLTTMILMISIYVIQENIFSYGEYQILVFPLKLVLYTITAFIIYDAIIAFIIFDLKYSSIKDEYKGVLSYALDRLENKNNDEELNNIIKSFSEKSIEKFFKIDRVKKYLEKRYILLIIKYILRSYKRSKIIIKNILSYLIISRNYHGFFKKIIMVLSIPVRNIFSLIKPYIIGFFIKIFKMFKQLFLLFIALFFLVIIGISFYNEGFIPDQFKKIGIDIIFNERVLYFSAIFFGGLFVFYFIKNLGNFIKDFFQSIIDLFYIIVIGVLFIIAFLVIFSVIPWLIELVNNFSYEAGEIIEKNVFFIEKNILFGGLTAASENIGNLVSVSFPNTTNNISDASVLFTKDLIIILLAIVFTLFSIKKLKTIFSKFILWFYFSISLLISYASGGILIYFITMFVLRISDKTKLDSYAFYLIVVSIISSLAVAFGFSQNHNDFDMETYLGEYHLFVYYLLVLLIVATEHKDKVSVAPIYADTLKGMYTKVFSELNEETDRGNN